ncbi:hypothetical protein llg_44920 [Luteolibacter sp. LG18]|nr:hypothetical protein llg_44920 [Luteolibacter sp. LG18]
MFGGVRIAENQTGDGGIPRVLDAEAEDLDGGRAEQFHKRGQSSGAVRQHDGELPDRGAGFNNDGWFHG